LWAGETDLLLVSSFEHLYDLAMAASGDSGDETQCVALATAQVPDALGHALAASTVGMSQAQARALLLGLDVQERRMHALRLRLVAESAAHDGRPREAAGGERQSDVAVPTAAWMRARLRVTAGRARGEVRAAALVDPVGGELRELGAALALGTTSAEHLRVACRTLNRSPATCGPLIASGCRPR
jgi:hypothetical protein